MLVYTLYLIYVVCKFKSSFTPKSLYILFGMEFVLLGKLVLLYFSKFA